MIQTVSKYEVEVQIQTGQKYSPIKLLVFTWKKDFFWFLFLQSRSHDVDSQADHWQGHFYMTIWE